MRDQITKTINNLEISLDDLRLVNLYKYEDILISILKKFTTLGKDGLNALWWESFKEPIFWIKPDYVPSILERLVPVDETVWFVALDWNRKKQNGNSWLYEGKIKAIIAVINELSHFEYYIVSKKFDWLLCENHHDLLIGVGEQMIDKMQKIEVE